MSIIYQCAQTKSLEYQIGDLKKNLTNGRSHVHVEDFCAHVEDDQKDSTRSQIKCVICTQFM